jgi:hypothetical protein
MAWKGALVSHCTSEVLGLLDLSILPFKAVIKMFSSSLIPSSLSFHINIKAQQSFYEYLRSNGSRYVKKQTHHVQPQTLITINHQPSSEKHHHRLKASNNAPSTHPMSSLGLYPQRAIQCPAIVDLRVRWKSILAPP